MPDDVRKIIFATNIAQTSVTIPGVRYVVDSGFIKQKQYDPRTGMDSLLIIPISKATAVQRAGRAGRTAPGKCFRLYSTHSYESHMIDNTIPEILRSSLSSVVLSIKSFGIEDLNAFPFIDRPQRSLVRDAIRKLQAIDALDDQERLTRIGRYISALPVDPPTARAQVAAALGGDSSGGTWKTCSNDVLTIVGMLSVPEEIYTSPRNEPKKTEAREIHHRFYHYTGDHVTLLNVYRAYIQCRGKIRGEAEYMRRWCKRHYINIRALQAAKKIGSSWLIF